MNQPPPVDAPTEREGVLFKKARTSLLKSWQKRWVYLVPEYLYYFKGRKSRPCAQIVLATAKVQHDAACSDFIIVVPATSLSFRAPTAVDAAAWVHAIRGNIARAATAGVPAGASPNGFTAYRKLQVAADDEVHRAAMTPGLSQDIQPSPTAASGHSANSSGHSGDDVKITDTEHHGMPTASNGHRADAKHVGIHAPKTGPIPAAQVPLVCNTGDIMLFASKGVRGSIIRAFTGADYDHVGLILKFKDNQLGVLETLGNTGAQVTNYQGFISEKWHEQYNAIVVRHLSAHVDESMAKQIEEFVKVIRGRKYDWSLMRAVRGQEKHNLEDERRVFFCSELVAQAYKHVGLLRASLDASAYVPGSFGVRNHLVLMKGANLGEERFIDFSAAAPAGVVAAGVANGTGAGPGK